MLYYVVTTLFVLDSILLILVILLQQGKGGDMANAFGGGGSQAVFGARLGATLLTRATSVLAGLFVVLALTLTVMVQRGPASVVGGVEPPAAPATPLNLTPAPATTPPPGNTPAAATTPPPPAAAGTPAATGNTSPK